jgi:hypothetical protein
MRTAGVAVHPVDCEWIRSSQSTKRPMCVTENNTMVYHRACVFASLNSLVDQVQCLTFAAGVVPETSTFRQHATRNIRTHHCIFCDPVRVMRPVNNLLIERTYSCIYTALGPVPPFSNTEPGHSKPMPARLTNPKRNSNGIQGQKDGKFCPVRSA